MIGIRRPDPRRRRLRRLAPYEGKPASLSKIDDVRVPHRVLNAVVFLGGRSKPGDPSTEEFVGSGFVVTVFEGGVLFPYLATAHHIAVDLERMKEPIARMNDAQGNGHHYVLPKPVHVSLPDRDLDLKAWYQHPTDEAADVAVTSFYPTFAQGWNGQSALANVPSWMLVPEKMLHPTRGEIGIGDEVFIVGLFRHAAGKDNNSPLLRVGHIAMVPKENIGTGPLRSHECIPDGG
jgi:hypothetical protein